MCVSHDSICWSALDPPVFRGSRRRRVLTPLADNYTWLFLAGAESAVCRSVSRWSARMLASIRICPLAVTAMARRSSRKVSGFPVPALLDSRRRFGAGGFSLPSSVVPPRSATSGALVSGGGPGPRVAGSVGRPRARVPGPGNPRSAVTASAGQCDWGPWAAPSGDPGAPRPPWAANPGVFPQPTFAIEN